MRKTSLPRTPSASVRACGLEPAPGHAGGKNDRLRLDHVAAVQVDEVSLGRRFDRFHRTRHDDPRSEALRLLKSAVREIAARDSAGKAEIVFDARRRAGLTARRFALADDHDVEVVTRRTRDEIQACRELAQGRRFEHASVSQNDDRIAPGSENLCRTAALIAWIARVEPIERDLIAREKVAQIVARKIVGIADDGRLGQRRRLICVANEIDPARQGLAQNRGGFRRFRQNCMEVGRFDAGEA